MQRVSFLFYRCRNQIYNCLYLYSRSFHCSWKHWYRCWHLWLLFPWKFWILQKIIIFSYRYLWRKLTLSHHYVYLCLLNILLFLLQIIFLLNISYNYCTNVNVFKIVLISLLLESIWSFLVERRTTQKDLGSGWMMFDSS